MVRAKRRKSNDWKRRHTRDAYVRRSKVDGYRSRAVYKLIEIDRRDHILRPGLAVVELGAAPGGWSQYVQSRIGPNGKLVAVDVLAMEVIPGAVIIQGDIMNPAVQQRILRSLPNGLADLVISDISPNISGIRDVDDAKALRLLNMSLEVAATVLIRGGKLLVKLFSGREADGFRSRCAARFEQCLVRKPGASRARSREIYLLAKGFLEAPKTAGKTVVRIAKP